MKCMCKALLLVSSAFLIAHTVAAVAQDLPPDLYQTTITVVGDRLSEEQEDLSNVPGSVTVLTKKEIAKSSARTLQELLAESGLHFQVNDVNGNGRTLGLELRGHQGFKGGLVLIVDGVRMNNPETNQADFSAIDLSQVERVEILRGAQGSIYGGDMASGVVRVITRRNRSLPELKTGLFFGNEDTQGAWLNFSGRKGKIDGRITASWKESDGYRDNGGYEETRFSLALNRRVSKVHDWGFSLYHNDDQYSLPGALESSDFAADRWQNPYNSSDFFDRKVNRATFHYRFRKETFLLSLVGGLSTEDGDSLATGRSAASFFGSGILSSTSQQHKSFAFEGKHRLTSAKASHRLVWGGEWNRNDFAALSQHTDSWGDIIEAPGGAFGFPRPGDTRRGWTDTDQTMTGLFLAYHGDWQNWSLDGALRHDQVNFDFSDKLGYEYLDFSTFTTVDVMPFSSAQSFSHWSGHWGATWRPGEGHTLYARIGQSWLFPSIQQLFAFPDFGSNPDLDPVRVRDFEVGYRLVGSQGTLQMALFESNMRGEIFFDAVSLLNENLGKTRRRGLEIDGRWDFHEQWSLRGGLQFIDAKIVADATGPATHADVPLVADFSGTFGLHFDNRDVTAYLQARHTGSRHLSSDQDNSAPKLSGHTLFEGGVEWQFHPQGSIRLDVHNLFNEKYQAWGVEFFDFLSFDPAARAFTAGEPLNAQLHFRWQF